MQPEESIAFDWARQAMRVGAVVDNQVRSLRKRQLVEGCQREPRRTGGAFWSIRSDPVNYDSPPGSLDAPRAAVLELASIKTRLAKLEDALQERLINWGYAICDTAMRRWAIPEGARPPASAFPYERGIG
jgi:NTE family protein